MRSLVFAFGSNLDPSQMARRCPSTAFVGRAHVDGYRLAFAGHSERWAGPVATIRKRARGTVHGVIYSITPGDLAALDRAEGAPHAYRRIRVDCALETGEVVHAFAYKLVRGGATQGCPSVEYFFKVMMGYRLWQIPVIFLRKALNRAAIAPATRLQE